MLTDPFVLYINNMSSPQTTHFQKKDCDSDIRLMRRIARDISERDRTPEEVIAQYSATVRPMHLEFVEPTKVLADIIIDCSGVRDSSVALKMITTYVKCEADARTVAFGADSK